MHNDPFRHFQNQCLLNIPHAAIIHNNQVNNTEADENLMS